jgi:hypothetical protein
MPPGWARTKTHLSTSGGNLESDAYTKINLFVINKKFLTAHQKLYFSNI